jgi:hypothetical protein
MIGFGILDTPLPKTTAEFQNDSERATHTAKGVG